MILKKNSLNWFTFLSMLIFILLLLLPLSTSAMSNVEKLPTESPESYIEYLKKYSIEDAYLSGITDEKVAKEAIANAEETLIQFERLSKDNQRKYLNILNDPDVFKKAFSKEMNGLSQSIKEDVAWTFDVKNNQPLNNLTSEERITITGTGTFWVLGVKVTEYEIKGTYDHNGYKPTKAVSVKAVVTRNWNPTVDTNLVSKDHDIDRSIYVADAIFDYKIGVNGVGGVQIGNIYIGVEGDASGKIDGYFYSKQG